MSAERKGKLMDYIKNTEAIHQSNLKCLIYGESGAGKTYLANTLTQPTLIISAESGLVSLTGSNIDYVLMSHF